jgi:hypothetical protein
MIPGKNNRCMIFPCFRKLEGFGNSKALDTGRREELRVRARRGQPHGPA